MIDASKVARHPAMAELLIKDLQAKVETLSAFIRTGLKNQTPPEQIRAALAPETENQYEAI